MEKSNYVFVLLGGNIEVREDYLSSATKELQNRLGDIINSSSIYETEAWGFNTENKFLNMVLLMETKLNAQSFLKGVLDIELDLGRKRSINGNYSSRTIDIDILYFNSEIIESENLIIPHLQLHLRKFVMIPLVEIAPDFIHPSYGKTNKELLKVCKDDSQVKLFVNSN